jgi:OPA family glycerol-3-phosphate transporter-like MFS transporter
MSWKVIMIICATLGLTVSAIWIAINPRIMKDPKENSRTTKKAVSVGERKPLPKYVFIPLIMIMLGIILQGILRDGVTNWMPSYMCEAFGLSEESAIVTAVIPAVFSILSFAVFDFMHRKLFKNEVTCAAVIFVGAAAAAGVLYAIGTAGGSVIASTLLLGLIIAFMHGINLMLITVVPKRFLKSGKVSTYSGLLNACTYIGASLSNYGFAVLAESYGWSFTILSWVVISAAGCIICFFAVPLWKRFTKSYAQDN